MADTIDIQGLFSEWEREETARRDQSDRLKEFFKTAKTNGYNPKGLRVAFAEKYALEHFPSEKIAKRTSDANDADLYLAALSSPRTPAYARGAEKAADSTTQIPSISEPFDPETGEFGTIQENQVTGKSRDQETRDPAPDSAQMQEAHLVSRTSLAGAEGIAGQHPILPETANETGDDLGHVATVAADHGTADAEILRANLGGSNVAVLGAHHAEGEGAYNAPSATITPIRPPKQFRPNCLNRQGCAASGPSECYQCTKAAAQHGASA